MRNANHLCTLKSSKWHKIEWGFGVVWVLIRFHKFTCKAYKDLPMYLILCEQSFMDTRLFICLLKFLFFLFTLFLSYIPSDCWVTYTVVHFVRTSRLVHYLFLKLINLFFYKSFGTSIRLQLRWLFETNQFIIPI